MPMLEDGSELLLRKLGQKERKGLVKNGSTLEIK